jgi:integrase
LFPPFGGRCNGLYSMNHFNRMKRELEKLAGVKFTIKELRASSATMMTDLDQNVFNSVSGQLRHKDERTSQRWYVKINRSRAGRSLEDAWKNRPGAAPSNDSIEERKPIPSQANNPQNPVIRSKFDITGYG